MQRSSITWLRVIAVLAVASGFMLLGTTPAQADYPAKIITSCGITVSPGGSGSVSTNQQLYAHVQVASGADQAATGQIELRINNRAVATKSAPNGAATFKLPRPLKKGTTYALTAQYRADPGSQFRDCGCSHGFDPAAFASGSNNNGGTNASGSAIGGLLPNTGGVWLLIPILALLALTAGWALVRGSRRRGTA